MMRKKKTQQSFKAQRRRANLEASSLRKILYPLCEDYGLRVKALGKHQIIDMIVRYEEQQHELNRRMLQNKEREDAVRQVQQETKKFRRSRNGISDEKRQNLDYKIKVAATTGVLDLSNPEDKNMFRYDFECIPDDVVERFERKDKDAEADIFTTTSSSSSEKLTSLWMTNNRLTRLHPRLGLLSHSLVRLGLEGNRLRELPSSLFELKNLQYLHLSRNQLTRIPKDLQRLSRLRKLDLRDNDLTELCEVLCRFRNLRRLDVSKNRIDRISSQISRLVSLVDLNLDNNCLIDLPAELSRTRGSLKFLGLANNSLRLSLDDYEENNEASRVLRKLRPTLIQLRIKGNKRVEPGVMDLHEWANSEWIELNDAASELKKSISLRHSRNAEKGLKRF